MALSTSSSERSVWILLIAGVLLAVAVMINAQFADPAYIAKRDEDIFWHNKVQGIADHSANIVLSGDSRVYRGLSPAVFDATLPGAKTVNFGFSTGGHNDLIFNQIDRILVTHDKRVVVLGITPSSLTPMAQLNEHYLDFKKKPPLPDAMGQKIEDTLRPLSWSRVRKITQGKTEQIKDDEHYEFLNDGWVKSDWKNHNPLNAIASYDHVFDKNQVSRDVIQNLYHRTRAWSDAGIIVIGYRPPSTPDMVTLENAKSGFDEAEFIKGFKAAGGVWIDIPNTYESYDGSHLTPESAEKLSKVLAQAIAARR